MECDPEIICKAKEVEQMKHIKNKDTLLTQKHEKANILAKTFENRK